MKINAKELEQLAEEVNMETEYELEQMKILKSGFDKLHAELLAESNAYAAGYLSVEIDRLQEVIDNYTKPLMPDDLIEEKTNLNIEADSLHCIYAKTSNSKGEYGIS